MITANDVYKMISEYKPDPEIDRIIEDKIIPVFKKELSKTTIRIECRHIMATTDYFVAQMSIRGFDVSVTSDDKMFSLPYYKITIPPQDE